jgi:organic radical activating enzyme
MNIVTTYRCEYCDAEFNDKDECRAHEKSHIHDHSFWNEKQLAEALEELAEKSYSHHVFGMVGGLPLEDFNDLMTVAARRLRAYGETL